MSMENWIHCELLKLGYEIAQSTVSKYRARGGRPPSQGWKTFLRNHAEAIAAIDMCMVPTLRFERLFAVLVLGHCDDQDTIVGFAGLQRVGADALLRSLVVFPARQTTGFGSAIVTWIVSFASSNGISRLFALTTTSQPFFRKCGFQTIDRASVPQSICGLTEFSESCCSSAYVMKRDLIRTG